MINEDNIPAVEEVAASAGEGKGFSAGVLSRDEGKGDDAYELHETSKPNADSAGHQIVESRKGSGK